MFNPHVICLLKYITQVHLKYVDKLQWRRDIEQVELQSYPLCIDSKTKFNSIIRIFICMNKLPTSYRMNKTKCYENLVYSVIFHFNSNIW